MLDGKVIKLMRDVKLLRAEAKRSKEQVRTITEKVEKEHVSMKSISSNVNKRTLS